MGLPLSVCIIARNEERFLRQCLQALTPLGAEIVLVDTGSTDGTRSIAEAFTDRIFDFPWRDDFAAARNHAAAQAANDRILAVDCDEFLTECDLELLERALRGQGERLGMILRRNPYPSHGERLVMRERIARLYDRRRFSWRGRIHENLMPLDQTAAPRYVEIPLGFYHAGYEDEDQRRRKAERDLRLLRVSLGESGDDPYLLFQMGQCYTVLGDMARAADYYDRGLSQEVDPRLAYVQDMLVAYGYALLDLKEYQTALGLEAVHDAFAGRADYLFLMGLIYMNNARFEDAVASFREAMATPLCSVEGTNSYRAAYNVGVIYEVTGRREEALAMYRSCGDYPPAAERIASVLRAGC